jgi:geranylgeranyl pyrophosphate synthase
MEAYEPSEALQAHIHRTKALLEPLLATAYPPEAEADSVETTGQAMRYMMFLGDGGKRLRPALTILAAKVCGGDEVAALPYARAVEEIHTYTLIVDDIQDNSEIRRNVATCHVRFGVNTALLAAGRLFERGLEPFHLMAPTDRAEIRRLVDGLHQGQAADLDAQSWRKDRLTLTNLNFIHGGKSSALLQLALWGGAFSAGASRVQKEALDQFGYYLGLAYQGRDDILGASSTEAEFGKPTGAEADEGKLTYPELLGSVEAAQTAIVEHAETACKYLMPNIFKDTSLLRELARYAILRTR